MKNRLFVDMDGVLAKFIEVEYIEKLYEKEYFRNLPPQMNVINSIKEIIKNKDTEVYILSAVIKNSKYAAIEKLEWLKEYLPEIDNKHILFTADGKSKIEELENLFDIKISKTDFLLDDYTKNLVAWENGTIRTSGTGIKLLNNINHTKGTWQGWKLHFEDERLYNRLCDVMKYETKRELKKENRKSLLSKKYKDIYKDEFER